VNQKEVPVIVSIKHTVKPVFERPCLEGSLGLTLLVEVVAEKSQIVLPKLVQSLVEMDHVKTFVLAIYLGYSETLD
jgi:hypothetical protein